MVLGSGIRKKPIPDPGSRGQKAPNPGSGSATLLISHALFYTFQKYRTAKKSMEVKLTLGDIKKRKSLLHQNRRNKQHKNLI